MTKLRRIVAGLSVVLIVGLVIATLVCAVTGSRYFFAMLFLALIIPVVLWVFMWFTRLMQNKSDEDTKERKK